MTLQDQALIIIAYMENIEVMFFISTPELLAHLASEESDGAIQQPSMDVNNAPSFDELLNPNHFVLSHTNMGNSNSPCDVDPATINYPALSILFLNFLQLHGYRPSVLPLAGARVDHERGTTIELAEFYWATGECSHPSRK
ncbi:hypothetical protein FXO38_18266 [Capsicum annuum]|nr:hypothetical protein FXO38_18266 [Capsicum annuum]KAF3651888.1 hypothetical protein FXO37_17781 [Capsicum annuum]